MGSMGVIREGAEGGGASAAEHPWPAAPAADDPYGPYACLPGGGAGTDGDDRVFEGEL